MDDGLDYLVLATEIVGPAARDRFASDSNACSRLIAVTVTFG